MAMSSELWFESDLCAASPGLNRMLWYVHTSQGLSVIKNFKRITQASHFYNFDIYGDGGGDDLETNWTTFGIYK